MLPRSCFLLADSKSNSSTRLPRSHHDPGLFRVGGIDQHLVGHRESNSQWRGLRRRRAAVPRDKPCPAVLGLAVGRVSLRMSGKVRHVSAARTARCGGGEPATRIESGEPPAIHQLIEGSESRVRAPDVATRRQSGDEADVPSTGHCAGANAMNRRGPRSGKIHIVHTCAIAARCAPQASAETSDPFRREQVSSEAAVLGAKPDMREAPHPGTSAAEAAKLASRPERTCPYYDGALRLASNAPVWPNRHACRETPPRALPSINHTGPIP